MKTVLITGVGRGIGRALAQVFLEKGFFVLGTTKTGDADFPHENLSLIQLDLTSEESIEKCAAALAAQGRKIDIFINNAGILLDMEDTVLDPTKLRATLEVNLVGPVDLTERLLPQLTPNAHIIFIDSTAGSLELAHRVASHDPGHYPAYKISKAAINMYMITLAERLREGQITVSSVHPGWVKTDMGGADADISPEEAARDICTFAISSPETGYFWHKGQKLPW